MYYILFYYKQIMLYILKQNKALFTSLIANYLNPAESFSTTSTEQEKPFNQDTITRLNSLKSDVNETQKSLDLHPNISQLIQQTWDSADNFINMHEKLNTTKFYKALESWINWWEIDGNLWLSDMWGAFWLIRELVWVNRADQYFTKLSSLSNKISKNQELFNNELSKILPRETRENDVFWVTYTQREEILGKYLLRDILIWLLLKDIPLLDLWLHFSKGLTSAGIPMDKALAFQNWVEWGMEWEPNYSNEKLAQISGNDLLESLWQIRVLLISAGLNSDQASEALKWNLENLTEKQEKIIKIVLKTRIIPDLENLNAWGFNWLEKFFDDKDNKIEKILRKLKWEKYNLDHIKANWNDVSLQQIGSNFILEVDDWGANTYKVYNYVPTEKEIKSAIKEYEAWWKQETNAGWIEKTTFNTSSTDIFATEENNQSYNALELDGWKYLLQQFGKYKIFEKKPTQKEINSIDISNWDTIEWNVTVNNRLSSSEILSEVSKAISILREQDTEWRWFTDNNELEKAIDRTEDRTEYLKSVNNEFNYINWSLKALKANDKEMYNRFSILWLFDSTKTMLEVFPSNDVKVNGLLKYMWQFKKPKEYLTYIKKLDNTPEVTAYFNKINTFYKNNPQNILNYLVNSIDTTKYNKNISMLSTLSFPITSNLLRSLAGKLSNDGSWNWFNSWWWNDLSAPTWWVPTAPGTNF